MDCGEEAASWVSDMLSQEGLRIIYYSHDLPQRNFIKETKLWETRALDKDVVSACAINMKL